MELGLRQLIRLARRWWWILILLPLSFGVLATLYREYISPQGTPTYSASATMLVNDSQGGGAPAYEPETFEVLLTGMPEPVLQAVVDELALPYDADTLQTKLAGSLAPETEVLVLTAYDKSPRLAAEIANSFARHFVAHVGQQVVESNGRAREVLDREITALESDISETSQQIQALANDPAAETPPVREQLSSLRTTLSTQQQSLRELDQQRRGLDVNTASAQSRVTVSEQAAVPPTPDPASGTLIPFIGVFVGLVLAGGIIFLLAYLDNTVRSGANFRALAGGPLLSEMPRIARLRSGSRQLFLIGRPRSTAAEAIRLLRTNIEFAAGEGSLGSIAITSPGKGEGKSTIAANLGVAMAQAGLNTVVIDANLRDPWQHRIFGISNEAGLTTLLQRSDQPWQEVAADTSIENLHVIPAGPTTYQPADLLSRDRLYHVLGTIGRSVDMILLDTPAILSVSDALVVSANVDGAILVCRSGRTRVDTLRRAAAALRQGSVPIVGVVLNQRAGRNDEADYTDTGGDESGGIGMASSPNGARRSGRPPR